MGRYIEWDDVINRYPIIDSIGGSDEISSGYIVYSEAYVDGMLAPCFTPPFSNNNMTVKDLVIDDVYWRAGRHKLEDALEVRSNFLQTVSMMKQGKLKMIDTSGSIISAYSANPGIYSSTQSYHSAFGIDDPIKWKIDDDQLSDEEDKRL